ncbi:MAG: aminotransferase class V-fold PLP-dependent enzyme [Pseudomonadota bacterium]
MQKQSKAGSSNHQQTRSDFDDHQHHLMFDVEFARSNFPAFSHFELQDQIMAENAGGSYPCYDTINALSQFYTRNKLQPYYPNEPSSRAGAEMDQSYQRWAEFLNVHADEVHFGPSTSANSYMLANAFSEILKPGDEIIVTVCDHEANNGAIRKMAKAHSITVREWKIDEQTQQLESRELAHLLNDHTRLICVTHCSNIIGHQNPIKKWAEMIKKMPQKPILLVDGVSNAPHHIPDIDDLGCDIYLFSLYKVYSVHQGLMVIRKSCDQKLAPQGHFFNHNLAHYRFTPAGPDHAQIGAAKGVLDYIRALSLHHDRQLKTPAQYRQTINRLWHRHEHQLTHALLDGLRPLKHKKGLTIIGDELNEARHPTVSFHFNGKYDPLEIVKKLGQASIIAGFGHFYAYRLMQHLAIDPDPGVVRISLVHYNRMKDVELIIKTLEQILDAA